MRSRNQAYCRTEYITSPTNLPHHYEYCYFDIFNFCEEFNTQVRVSYTLNLLDMISETCNVVMLVTADSQYHANIIYIYVYDLYRYSILHVQLHCFSNYHHQTSEKYLAQPPSCYFTFYKMKP